jgi:hypothetical protein
MKNVLEKASNELSMNGFRLVDPEVRALALRQFGRAYENMHARWQQAEKESCAKTY